jgi:uncharacterized protein (DUF427 family)
VIARSDETVVVERIHYFPPGDVSMDLFEPSDHRTSCPRKSCAGNYSVVIGDDTNRDPAWHYPSPFRASAEFAA